MQGISLVDLSTTGAADTPALKHLNRIIHAATARPAGRPISTAVRCRRRPGGTRCAGYIEARTQDLPELVRWRCVACGDVGVARHWRSSPWRIRRTAMAGPRVRIVIPQSAWRTLERWAPDDALAQRVVWAAVPTDGGFRLDGGVDTFRRLHRCLSAVGQRDGRPALEARAAARLIAAGLSRWTNARGGSRRG